MSTATETLEQEYNRLFAERDDIGLQVRQADRVEPEVRARYDQVMDRLREIVAIPAEGYELPKQAADLIAFAETHGWLTGVQWTPPGWADEVYVRVKVGRRLTEAELQAGYYRSDAWLFEITYHERGCPPGQLKKFGSGRGVTPEVGAANIGPAPSVKAIRAVIEQHPAPEAIS